MRLHTLSAALLAAAALAGPARAQAQSTDGPAAPPVPVSPEPALPAVPPPAESPAAGFGLVADVRDYFTAPLHWNRNDWAWFGGSLLAVGLAHRYDAQVRSHVVSGTGATTNTSSHDLKDAIPAAAAFAATFGYANLIGDHDGRQEAWAMLEAAGLGTVTAYGLKYAIGRQGPDVTSNPNEWEKSGNSFPSVHATAAFAIGTVLAESGNDDYRFVRRLLGYGIGTFTAYERLKHNAHWLSDTVAGAALGVASARFVMNHRYAADTTSGFTIVPLAGGAMLSYNLTLP